MAVPALAEAPLMETGDLTEIDHTRL